MILHCTGNRKIVKRQPVGDGTEKSGRKYGVVI